MNIRLLLASEDANYTSRLGELLQGDTSQTEDLFEIFSYTEKKTLLDFFQQESKQFEICLVDEPLLETVSERSSLVFVLTEDVLKDCAHYDSEIKNIFYLNKYQRASAILRKMNLEFSKLRTGTEKIGDAKLSVFLSPVGGVGTSTLSAAFALACRQREKTPLHISLERFNSSTAFFNSEAYDQGDKGLYTVFEVLLSQKGDVVQTINSAREKDEETGVFFLRGFPAFSEVLERTEDEIEKFINAARGANDTDMVVIDLGDPITPFAKKVLELADDVYVVGGASQTAQLKLKTLLQDTDGFFDDFLSKTALIYNKTQSEIGTLELGVKKTLRLPRLAVSDEVRVAKGLSAQLDTLVGGQ